MPSITIFNTNPNGVNISVNHGATFSIAGAGGPGWAPQSPAGGGPGWSNSVPAPNVFAPGSNYLKIMPQNGAQPPAMIVTLPANVRWGSLQLYIGFNERSDLTWIALNDGQFVAGKLGIA